MPIARTESWWDPEQRDAMLLDLLAAIKHHGPLDNEQLARACVPIDELVGSIPGQERQRRAAALVEGLIAYLEEDGDLSSLDAPTRLWRQSIERARVLLRWRELPPVVGRLSILYADTLIRHAYRHGWVTKFDIPSGPLWRVTEAGIAELEELQTRLEQAV